MQASPDYTEQLKQIAQALNRPATPTWLISILSLVVGAVLTLAVQFLLKWADIVHAKYRLQKILYRDIGQAVMFVHATFQEMRAHPELTEYYHEQLQSSLTPDTQVHLKSKLELYAELPEHNAAEHLYEEFRKLIAKTNERHVTAGRIVWLVGHYLQAGSLRANLFKKYLPDGAGARVVALAVERYGDGERIIARVRQEAGPIESPDSTSSD